MNKTEKPCRSYERNSSCKDGRDHCFNCGRHLDAESQRCPKGCGEGTTEAEEAANNEEE